MLYLKYFFQVTFIWSVSKLRSVRSQNCPKPVDSTYPCTSIQNWDDFVNIITKESNSIVFCPFNIQKPPTADPLIILKTVTAVCRTEGGCIINASPFEAKGILKIKGQGQVSIYGFVFQSSGTPFNTVSAVHIAYAASMNHSFCSCIFKGIRGMMRGTVVRSEPKTNVQLVDCLFEANSSKDIGSIFNRGNMIIESCTFNQNYGKGGAIGSSSGSLTTLSNNSFKENKNGVPLFFHGNDFVDSGGNNAFNNAQCNGIFVQNSKKCVPLRQSKDDVLRQPPEPVEEIPFKPSVTKDVCERAATNTDSCISVGSFEEFKAQVERTSGTLIFCPFTLNKNPNEMLYISTNVQLVCKEPKECRIKGSNSHIQIVGEFAKVFFQGFVFEGASTAAVHILSSARQPHIFCNCHFVDNQGQTRGVGLLAERYTEVEVSSCLFENNKSNDLGGSIFNRGSMTISESTFRKNVGRGGAIGNASRAPMKLKSNRFVYNQNGVPIFFHDLSYSDLGENVVQDNDVCNGLWIEGMKKCVSLQSQSTPSSAPQNKPNEVPTPPILTEAIVATAPSSAPQNKLIQIPTSPILTEAIVTTATRGGVGYFNYNMNDNKYGPRRGWGNVRLNPEHLRYQELLGTLKRSLVNKCEWNNINQSPIDLCENKINNDCDEYHQTRTHSGNISLGDQQVTAQILPSKLRLKYYPDRPPEGGPYPPEADFARNWNGFAEVNHVDIKIPSEHTLCGTQYPAELSIYMAHPIRRQTIVMSILLAFHDNDKKNNHLQKAIDEWQKVYDRNKMRCNGSSTTRNLRHSDELQDSYHDPKIFNATSKGARRNLKDETPFGRGGWHPFHPSLERTIYFWGYWGSLTEPPCSTFVSWRVLTEPAYISKSQWEQMKNILFSNQNKQCEYTSVNNKQSVARPIQPFRGRLLHKCTVNDYVSDREKEAMRKETGNPNWCC